jgi:glycosidase
MGESIVKKVGKRAIVSGLIASLLICGCGGKSESKEQSLNIIDDKYRTTYEVFVYSFYDSDGDGIGDLKGLTEKLDYINDGDNATDSDLGCNEIWLMPISPSPTYHKYDVTDYMNIDPEYGTLEDFDHLIEECNKRNVNVIIDLVLNHTSSEHPWFLSAENYIRNNVDVIKDTAKVDADGNISFSLSDLASCPCLDYYRFSFDEQSGYAQIDDTGVYYEARFWEEMPDLNLDSNDVKREIEDITKFWIDRGVAGFRLDAVTSYYTSDDPKNIEFLTWLNDEIKEQKADAYIVGEAWTSIATYSKYYKSGIDSFFDFNASGSEGTIAAVSRGSLPASSYAENLKSTEDSLRESNENAINASFYTNHDMARSAGYYTGKGSQDKVKIAGALNLLTSGNAFIYYGEELGMKGSGKDENKRAPMYWSSDENAGGMCAGPKDMDSFDMKYPSYEEQKDDETSIYNYYKKAIKLRNLYPVIARGVTEPLDGISGSEVCSFIRKEKNEGEFETGSLLIVVNSSDEPQSVNLAADEAAKEYDELVYSLKTNEDEPALEGTTLTVPAYGIAVLK